MSETTRQLKKSIETLEYLAKNEYDFNPALMKRAIRETKKAIEWAEKAERSWKLAQETSAGANYRANRGGES